jgi:hypothetical protein
MKKTRGQKSRATVPLINQFIEFVQHCIFGFSFLRLFTFIFEDVTSGRWYLQNINWYEHLGYQVKVYDIILENNYKNVILLIKNLFHATVLTIQDKNEFEDLRLTQQFLVQLSAVKDLAFLYYIIVQYYLYCNAAVYLFNQK